MQNLYEQIISFIMSPPFEGWLFTARIVFIAIGLFFFIGMVIFFLASSWIKFLFVYDIFEFLTFRQYGVRKMERIWRKIVSRLDTGLESEYKLAVIEADNMLDDILKRMGYGGENLGERLEKITEATLPNMDEIQNSHQIRNDIVRIPDYKLSLDDTKKALALYEKALQNLEAI